GGGREPRIAGDEPSVRAGSDARILAVAPVQQVVARFRSGPGMVRNLIGRESMLPAGLLGDVVESAARLLVGHRDLPGIVETLEPGARLDGELVEGKVLDRIAD